MRRPATVCNERVFSAERNTNCALTPFPVFVALSPRPPPRAARADTFAGAGFGIHPRNERLLQRGERVRRYIPFPLDAPPRSSRSSLPSLHPPPRFRRSREGHVLPARAGERASGAETRGQVVTGCACFLAGERARDIMRRLVYTRTAPQRDDQRAVKRASAAMIF